MRGDPGARARRPSSRRSAGSASRCSIAFSQGSQSTRRGAEAFAHDDAVGVEARHRGDRACPALEQRVREALGRRAVREHGGVGEDLGQPLARHGGRDIEVWGPRRRSACRRERRGACRCLRHHPHHAARHVRMPLGEAREPLRALLRLVRREPDHRPARSGVAQRRLGRELDRVHDHRGLESPVGAQPFLLRARLGDDRVGAADGAAHEPRGRAGRARRAARVARRGRAR